MVVKKFYQLLATPDDAEEHERDEKIIVGEAYPAVVGAIGRGGPRRGHGDTRAAIGAFADVHRGTVKHGGNAFSRDQISADDGRGLDARAGRDTGHSLAWIADVLEK